MEKPRTPCGPLEHCRRPGTTSVSMGYYSPEKCSMLGPRKDGKQGYYCALYQDNVEWDYPELKAVDSFHIYPRPDGCWKCKHGIREGNEINYCDIDKTMVFPNAVCIRFKEII
jgi:hypothetical protein